MPLPKKKAPFPRDDAWPQLLVDAVVRLCHLPDRPRGPGPQFAAARSATQGLHAEEIIGRPFATFFTAEDRPLRSPQGHLQPRRTNEPIRERGLASAQGRHPFLDARGADAVRDPDGNVIGFAKVTRDMTERRLEHS